MKRIVKCKTGAGVCFVPQWNDGHNWQNYFGYRSNSPYLSLKYFNTPEEAEQWILSGKEVLEIIGIVKEF